jgi:hypothetical protein
MENVLEFRRPTVVLTPEQLEQQILTSKQALDFLLSELVCHVMPLWIEKQWPFQGLEILAEQIRSSLAPNTPDDLTRAQVRSVADDLKPAWTEIASQAEYIF